MLQKEFKNKKEWKKALETKVQGIKFKGLSLLKDITKSEFIDFGNVHNVILKLNSEISKEVNKKELFNELNAVISELMKIYNIIDNEESKNETVDKELKKINDIIFNTINTFGSVLYSLQKIIKLETGKNELTVFELENEKENEIIIEDKTETILDKVDNMKQIQFKFNINTVIPISVDRKRVAYYKGNEKAKITNLYNYCIQNGFKVKFVNNHNFYALRKNIKISFSLVNEKLSMYRITISLIKNREKYRSTILQSQYINDIFLNKLIQEFDIELLNENEYLSFKSMEYKKITK